MDVFKIDSLMLYKNRPARLLSLGERIDIQLENHEVVRVRPKDITLLHPGPVKDLAGLTIEGEGDLQAAWEILAGEETNLKDLAELIYGEFTPRTAWAVWQYVLDQLYFSGTPNAIQAHNRQDVEAKEHERRQAESRKAAWKGFIDRARQGIFDPNDQAYLSDVEALAYGRGARCLALRELGRAETPENAHALLLELKVWDAFVNPYPIRQKLVVEQVNLPVPDLPEEERLDLTGLPAFAIDDEGNDTPDDAISLDGDRIWVHIADAAALIKPESPIDVEAQARVMSLHLPEGTVHLLPQAVTFALGLGIQEVTPALSFGIDVDEDGNAHGFEVVPSLIRAARLTYAEAEERMEREPFRTLLRRLEAVRKRRRENQAVMIDFPEAKISVEDKTVHVQPLQPYRSRLLVEEAMILTGAAMAQFASAHGISLPFSQQDPPETPERPESLSGMFKLRRSLKRSQFHALPGPHHGLGVPAYCQVTSPLRRYIDLISHQQIRAYLAGKPGMTSDHIGQKIDLVEAGLGSIRAAELESERHWTLVYLLQHPDWKGEGALVEKRGSSGLVIIPDLALEIRVHLRTDWPLDQGLLLKLSGVNLAQGEVSFRVED